MDDSFRVTYENDDGYVGGSRPHHMKIGADDLWIGMTEDEIRDFFWAQVEEHFTGNHVNLHSKQEAEFILWAKEQLGRVDET